MASKFQQEMLKTVIGQICQTIGFQGIQSSCMDVMIDLLHRYLKEIAVTTHRYTEHYERTVPTLNDLEFCFKEMGINPSDIEEFINYVEPGAAIDVPKLPIENPSDLNFLKPGAKEIVSRPLYIHEHLPPMYPEKEEENELQYSVIEEETSDSSVQRGKRPGEADGSPYKKLKSRADEEGESTREIDSVMMTTSGYISSAREGKMPEARRPDIPLPVPRSKSPKGSSSIMKKKAAMEKIMRHKSQQEGIIAGNIIKTSKPKVKPPVPVAVRPQTPVAPLPMKDPELEKPKEEPKKKKRDRDDRDRRKDKRREERTKFLIARDNRMRIRMRGLSKEEELKRYKERENELLAALALSANLANINVTSLPGLRVRDSSQGKSPSKSDRHKSPKLPKPGSLKQENVDPSCSDSPGNVVVKEEMPSPPSSPNSFYYNDSSHLSTTPSTPDVHANNTFSHTPIKIKSEKSLLEPSLLDKSYNSSHFSPNWGNSSEGEVTDHPKTPDISSHSGSDHPLPFIPPFPNGPSLIPPPLGRYPFIPPFGAAATSPPALESPNSSIPLTPTVDSRKSDGIVIGDVTPPSQESTVKIPPSTQPQKTPKSPNQSNSSGRPLKMIKSPNSKSGKGKSEKEKKKEHKEKKKEKEKLREKKEKEKIRKRREKEKAKEEKKRLKKEQKEKLKKELKEKLRKEKKLKKMKKEESSKDSVPKLMLKIQSETDPDQEKTADKEDVGAAKAKAPPKLVIKPVLPRSPDADVPDDERPKKRIKLAVSPVPSPRHASPDKASPLHSPSSPPTEIAKFSALITRPPKTSQSKKSSDTPTVPPLKIKDNILKISKKDKDSGFVVSNNNNNNVKTEPAESIVPPLKIKNAANYSPSPSLSKHSEDRTRKSEKKEKKKSAPLVITSLGTVDSDVSSPPQSSIAPAPQLPPPIRIPPEMPKASKKSGAGAPSHSSGPAKSSSGLLTETMGPIGHFVDDQGNEVWICPTCGKQDDGSPMIGCDTCDDWYHWLCVGIHVPPSERENWYCPRCISQHKHQRPHGVPERKKRGRKRKIID